MKQLLEIEVKGNSGKTFGFSFRGDPRYLAEWRAEGFVINEIVNTIPVWAQQLGLTCIWRRVQDAWQWLRVW